MSTKKHTYIKRGDVILLSALLLLCAILIAFSFIGSNKPAGYALIEKNGEALAKLPLSKDAVYTVSDTDTVNVVEIKNGEAYISEASCPDGLCEKYGAISKTGEIIVCLPNRVTVRIIAAEQELDAVAY